MTYELVYQPGLKALPFGKRLHPDLRYLPQGCDVVRNPETGIRQVRQNRGYLVPQVIEYKSKKRPTDWELWENLRAYARKTGEAYLFIQRVNVDIEISRLGKCLLTFTRYNDARDHIRIDNSCDSIMSIYLTKMPTGKYKASWLRQRGNSGSPIPGIFTDQAPTLHAAFLEAIRAIWS